MIVVFYAVIVAAVVCMVGGVVASHLNRRPWRLVLASWLLFALALGLVLGHGVMGRLVVSRAWLVS